VLQCAAVCCSALQRVAVCRNVMQCVAGCCRVLQGVAGCCRVLHCFAVCCSVLQCVTACFMCLHSPTPSPEPQGCRLSHCFLDLPRKSAAKLRYPWHVYLYVCIFTRVKRAAN